MNKIFWLLAALIFISLIVVSLAGCSDTDDSSTDKELIIFHAGSLSVPFREISALFEEKHPEITIKAEAAGSRDCARKILDLGRRCDVLGSADYRVIENLLMLDYARFNIQFTMNEMAIAYTDKSRMSEVITAGNWHEILLKKKVVFGRADPNRDPCGYRTIMLFQLAEKYYGLPGFERKMSEKGGGKYIRPKETDLLVLLEAGEIDYLFIYRSVAAQHGLKTLLLPDEINLKSPSQRQVYNSAEIKITGKKPGGFITRKGEPIVYSVTIPKGALNREAAIAWIELLLSAQGRAIMESNGQESIVPSPADRYEKVPDELKRFCVAKESFIEKK